MVAFETLRRGKLEVPRPQFLPLLAWGYLQYRLIGDPPPGAELASPALEDAYLLLLGRNISAADGPVPTPGRA